MFGCLVTVALWGFFWWFSLGLCVSGFFGLFVFSLFGFVLLGVFLFFLFVWVFNLDSSRQKWYSAWLIFVKKQLM